MIVMEGKSAFLNCDTQGDPEPEITWKKDGVILDPTSDLDIDLTPFGSLQFSSVKLRDDGRYVCIATNPAGSAVKDFTLIVHGMDREFDSVGNSLELNANYIEENKSSIVEINHRH